MEERTRSFLRRNFAEYYRDVAAPEETPAVTRPEALEELPGIPEVGGREFGFIDLEEPFPDDTVMRRHVGFAGMQGLLERMGERPPAHVYHSAAVYRHPAARRMEEKDLKYADLIFDLDMDHLRDMPDSFPEMLEAVKEETLILLEEFVYGDLGVPFDDTAIAFSGGRGYHVHVRSQEFRNLGAKERREIVDYVRGKLSPESYLTVGPQGGQKLPGSGEPGWDGRINRAVCGLLEELKSSEEPHDEVKRYVEDAGFDVGVGETIVENLLSLDVGKVERGFFDPPKVPKKVLKALIREAALRAGSEIDEPVTSDTHRLIRVPGSLHGGSGFRVTPLTLEELKEFDPLSDGVAFNDDPILVEGKGFTAFLRGEKFEAPEGKEVEVPRYAAVFMALRGGAEVR